MDQPKSNSRRSVIGAAGAAGALTAIGFPAIVRSQPDAVRLGHLTPLTGFLGPLGEYAVMGVRLAVEEINAAGGINGRKVELIAEDSVNPQTASTKAERLIERDKVVAIVGEISSASGLAIAQVAQRNKILFFNTGCNSDELRGKSCNRYMFHTEAANSMYVGAAGQALLRDGLVKGQEVVQRHGRLCVRPRSAEGCEALYAGQWRHVCRRRTGGDQRHGLFALPTEDPQCQARSRGFESRGRADHELHEAVHRIWFALSVGRLRFRHCSCVGRGQGQCRRHLAAGLGLAGQVADGAALHDCVHKKYGKPPENQAWGDYLSTKHLAQAMNDIKSTDSTRVAEHMEKGARFDVLKTREGYYRAWDHQLMQEMYTVTFKPEAQVKDKWELFNLSAPVPGANQSLEIIAPTREENPCTMPA